MGALQPMHLIVILIIVLIVFGPGKLANMGGQLGKGMREFREATSDEGAKITHFCTQCGGKNDVSARNCVACGVALGSNST